MLNQFLFIAPKRISLVVLMIVLFCGSLYATGEKIPFSLICRILPENPVVVEAGAQFGEDTTWMAEIWTSGTIHAFEPVPASYEHLATLKQKFSNVNTYPIALTGKQGTTSMYLAGGASSVLRPTESFNNDYFHSDLSHPIEVACTTLDQWASDHNVEKIDFLWLDMEGNELKMLQASPKMVKRVKLIYTEVNLQPFWGRMCSIR